MKNWRPLKPEELSEDGRKVFDVLNDESDLACVLIGSSYLGELLASILEVRFIEGETTKRLLAPNGAIGTFEVRTDLAYCLGLINKGAYQDLRLIAEIRNKLAHKHIALNFGDLAIRQLCEDLRICRIAFHGQALPTKATQKEMHTWARNRFNISVALLSQIICVDALSLKLKEKPQYPAYRQGEETDKNNAPTTHN